VRERHRIAAVHDFQETAPKSRDLREAGAYITHGALAQHKFKSLPEHGIDYLLRFPFEQELYDVIITSAFTSII